MFFTRSGFATLLFLILTISGAQGRAVVGYFPSWDLHHHLTDSPQGFSHVVVAFARPDFAFDGKSFQGTGLQFEAPPAAIKAEIAALKARHQRVLLAVGGANYSRWTPLAAEANRPGPITTALTRLVRELGFDGIDVDYEDPGTSPAKIAQYRAVILALRRVAGNGTLTLAAWPSGADCTKETGVEACGGKLSYLDNGAGRERLLFRDAAIASKIDMVSVMSYDSGLSAFDPVRAYGLYRALLPTRLPLNIGFETAPEAWGGALLVGQNRDAKCAGALVQADQFGTVISKPYAIERGLQEGPLAGGRGDGAMLWHIFKDQNLPRCGAANAASPQDALRIFRQVLH